MTVRRFYPITDPNLSAGIVGIVNDALRADHVDLARWSARADIDPTDPTRVVLYVLGAHAALAENALRGLLFTVRREPFRQYPAEEWVPLFVREPVISHTAACDRIGHALIGDPTPTASALCALLRLHYEQPGKHLPRPDCTNCHGTSAGADGEHCHCGCGLCTGCGDATCEGPCETIALILAEVSPHDLFARIAVENAAETAGRLAADDRTTCYAHRTWTRACAHQHGAPGAILMPRTEGPR